MKTFYKKTRTKKQKIIFTLAVLSVVCALSGIPTPGVNPGYFKAVLSDNSAAGLFNLMSGGGLNRMSITMLSVTPYITASIIMQLLAFVFPVLSDIQKDGETGRKKFHQYTIVLGGVLALMEAFGFAIGFGKQGLLISYKWYWVLLAAFIWTAAALLCIGAGEIIDKKGIGNGISLILLCNILSSYPSDIYSVYQRFVFGKKPGPAALAVTLMVLFVTTLFAFALFVQSTEKRLHIVYSNKMQGKISAAKSVFPVKLCPGTVVPIIFASTIMAMPSMITAMLGKEYWICNMLNSSYWFRTDKPLYSIGVPVYLGLIIMFSFFYAEMILNPLEIANNLKKSGGMFPGIRPGASTVSYLKRQIRGTIGIGSVCCCLIALVPCVLSGVFGLSRLSFAGTSILITVGVIAETRDKLKSEDSMKKLSLFH